MAQLWRFWLRNGWIDYITLPAFILLVDWALGGPFYTNVLQNWLLR